LARAPSRKREKFAKVNFMGRMLETMKLGDGRRSTLAISKPVDGAPVQDCVVDWEIGEEVPFVEVGGPNKKIELSPGLLKHPAQTTPQAPHLPIETAVAPKAKTVNLTEPRPMTAVFAPWPAPAPMPTVSPEIIAYHQPDHATSKEYAALLSMMRRGLKVDDANVLLLLGARAHVGTTTVLLNLAVTAAHEEARVIVVDANPARASLAQCLGQSASGGLAEVLDGSLALEKAVLKTGIGSLHLLPAGASAKGALTNKAMSWLAMWLRERYDLIFIDGPTIEDAASHVPQADGIYLVLPQGESLPKGVAEAVNRMGGRLCGLIHTHFEM
jgi:Mrp family chromosome partitioning ATPase